MADAGKHIHSHADAVNTVTQMADKNIKLINGKLNHIKIITGTAKHGAKHIANLVDVCEQVCKDIAHLAKSLFNQLISARYCISHAAS